jgi:LPS-assembly lipoprotein
MWLSDRSSRRRVAAALGLFAVTVVLAGCSFTPVYGPGSIAADLGFSYAEPDTRTQQIVYQDLMASFTGPPSAGFVAIAITATTRAVSRTASGSLFTGRQKVLSAKVSVTDGADAANVLFSDAFETSATFETSGQVLADRAAEADAETRAAHALAQTIRLAFLGAFAH